MAPNATSDFLIGPMRVMTMSPMTYFYVTNQPTPFADLDRDLDTLLDHLHTSKAQAGLAEAGPDITRYYRASADEPDLYLMEIGVPVPPDTQPVGQAQVKTLPPYHCAGLLLWGSLAHIPQAYQALIQAIQEAGLERTSECREWNYYVEDGKWESPDNLMGICMEIR